MTTSLKIISHKKVLIKFDWEKWFKDIDNHLEEIEKTYKIITGRKFTIKNRTKQPKSKPSKPKPKSKPKKLTTKKLTTKKLTKKPKISQQISAESKFTLERYELFVLKEFSKDIIS